MAAPLSFRQNFIEILYFQEVLMVRQLYKPLLRSLLSEQMRRFRSQRRLTQEQMAERLRVAPRSYADLEHEKYTCSALTVFLFLTLLEDEDIIHLVRSLQKQIEQADHHDAA